MRILPLNGRTPGRFTLIDDSDFEWAFGKPWLYRCGQIATKSWEFLHRDILEREGHDLSGMRVVHKNSWRLDNRRINLHVSSRGSNAYSRKRRNIQRYPIKGFRIQVGQKAYGYAPTRKEAEEAWDAIVVSQGGVLAEDEKQHLRDELVGLLDSLVSDGTLIRQPGESLDDKYRLVLDGIVH